MQCAHYHNICWYHPSGPAPISALHFHHLLGTEFHHSRHSCPPPSLLPSLPPPLPLFLFYSTTQLFPTASSIFAPPRTRSVKLIRGCFAATLSVGYIFVFNFCLFLCGLYQTGRYQSGAWRRYVLLNMKLWLTDIVSGLEDESELVFLFVLFFVHSCGAKLARFKWNYQRVKEHFWIADRAERSDPLAYTEGGNFIHDVKRSCWRVPKLSHVKKPSLAICFLLPGIWRRVVNQFAIFKYNS